MSHIQAAGQLVSQLIGKVTRPAHELMLTNVCPSPPPGVRPFGDMIVSWVKWGVLYAIIGAGFVAVGALLIGKFGGNGRVGQFGSSALLWVIAAAIAYVAIYGVLTGIIGRGC